MADWRSAPFAAHFVGVESSMEDADTLLPFRLSGATQQGREHQLINQNNQDAATLYIGKQYLFGIVCDGCTGTSGTLINEVSNNEVGAKLTCVILSDILRSRMAHFGKDRTFLDDVMRRYIRRFQALCTIMGEHERGSTFVHDFLMNTVIGFVVNETRYVVFHYGDGFWSLNGRVQELRDSGSYVGSYLLRHNEGAVPRSEYTFPRFRVLSEGDTSSIESLLIATDGMLPIIETAQPFFEGLNDDLQFRSNPSRVPYLLPAFRKTVLEPTKSLLSDCPQDDASFVILTRITSLVGTGEAADKSEEFYGIAHK